ncbi:MAG: hypothetical protein GY938_17000 [Ketobacter sp.]|nr:hypothetical protein [Ketobacter sp.]
MIETTGNAETEKYLILAQELMRRVYADVSSDEIHTWLQSQLGKVAAHGNEAAALEWLQSFPYYDDILSKRTERANLPASERRELTWPWATWNKMIDPFEPGLLAVIAAGDGMGKTIYCEELAEHWAKAGLKVAFVHFELNRSIMLDRRASRHARIERRELKKGPFNQALYDKWNAARNILKQYPGEITYWHTPGWSFEQVTRTLEPEIASGNCDVIVIDYLEKAQPSQRQIKMYGANKWQREADDTEWMKTFAERTETPVLMLAQMSKAGKTAGSANLDRTAIRGAGEKTEKANIVVLLSRDNSDDGYLPFVNVRIDKNTLGPTGTFQQYMLGQYFSVGDIETEL